MDKNKIKISFVAYNCGEYDMFIEDVLTGEKTCLTGKTFDLTEKDLKMLWRVAPPCVMSLYEEVE